MRRLAPLAFLALAGCALSPGQLDPTKITATQSCVNVIVLGNPVAGTSTATATVPVSGLPGGLGAVADTTTTATPPTYGVTITCRP